MAVILTDMSIIAAYSVPIFLALKPHRRERVPFDRP
jgi:hypothetical protein